MFGFYKPYIHTHVGGKSHFVCSSFFAQIASIRFVWCILGYYLSPVCLFLRYDIAPEIMDGRNVADFIDEDIMARYLLLFFP